MFGSSLAPLFRRPVAALGLSALACVFVLAACADNPADGVTRAEVSEPAPAVSEVSAAPEDGAPAAAPPAPKEIAPDAPSGPPAAPALYVISPRNSKLEFVGSKVTRSHQGGFANFSGVLQLNGESPEGATLTVTVATDSIWADDAQLTGHLKSPDFFDVAKFPEAKFELASAAPGANGYDLTGTLTLHGVTKQITFPAAIQIGEGKVTATSEFAIDRFDFGIVYPGKADDLIRREVVIKLTINAEARQA